MGVYLFLDESSFNVFLIIFQMFVQLIVFSVFINKDESSRRAAAAATAAGI